MGMFNTIYADLRCPTTGQVAEQSIQIKWQTHDARSLSDYQLGDTLEDLEPEYDNTWIRTDYLCNTCSPKTPGHGGMPFIRSDDQRWHVVLVEIRAGRILQIRAQSEVQRDEIAPCVDDTWPPKPWDEPAERQRAVEVVSEVAEGP